MVDYMYPHNRAGLCDGIIDAYKELGIRGILGRGCMDSAENFGVHPGIMQQKAVRDLPQFRGRKDQDLGGSGRYVVQFQGNA